MRILGELKHDRYKVTVLEMNHKISIQIEEGLFVQTYRFRDGDIVGNLEEAKRYCDKEFYAAVTDAFVLMYKNRSVTDKRKTSI